VSDYKTIRTSVLPQITEVRLYNETVEKVRRGHPEIPVELPCIQTAVESAIVNPTHVERSYVNSFVYTDAGTTNAEGDPLRVPVKNITETSARVKSFYFASPPTEADVVYRRGDE